MRISSHVTSSIDINATLGRPSHSTSLRTLRNSGTLFKMAASTTHKSGSRSTAVVVEGVDGAKGSRPSFKDSHLSLAEVVERLDNLQQPPAPRDMQHFVKVCGLKTGGLNPHKLQVGKQITKEMMQSMFGLGRGRSSFHYLECKNADAKRAIQSLWPLCYSKPGMPPNKLISTEFCLGILAEVELQWDIDWAAFAAETNAGQRKRYKATRQKYENLREALLKRDPSQSFSDQKFASTSNVTDAVAGLGRAVKSVVTEWSSQWCSILATEVGQLLEVVRLECQAFKQKGEQILTERSLLNDECRAQRLLKDSVHATLLEEESAIKSLATAEICGQQPCKVLENATNVMDVEFSPCDSLASLVPAPSQTFLGEQPNVSSSKIFNSSSNQEFCVLESDALLEKRMSAQCLRSLHVKHEAQYASLHARCEEKEQESRAIEHKLHMQTTQVEFLNEQHQRCLNKRMGFALSPHPMVYNVDGEEASKTSLLKFAKIHDCAYCSQPFPLSDLILSDCRHCYHPWCALVHFKTTIFCAESTCKAQMPIQWLKSFGFCEPNVNDFDKEQLNVNEDSRKRSIALRKHMAMLQCPTIGDVQPQSPPMGSLGFGDEGAISPISTQKGSQMEDLMRDEVGYGSPGLHLGPKAPLISLGPEEAFRITPPASSLKEKTLVRECLTTSPTVELDDDDDFQDTPMPKSSAERRFVRNSTGHDEHVGQPGIGGSSSKEVLQARFEPRKTRQQAKGNSDTETKKTEPKVGRAKAGARSLPFSTKPVGKKSCP